MPEILSPLGPRQTIVIVAGRREEAACGVWDYSVLLAEALRRTGAEVRLVNARDWSLRGFLALARSLRGEKARILIQYPSSAFEKRLLPYFLPFALMPHRTAVTIHEFSYKRLPAKILTCLPMAFAGSVVFTSPVEAAAARHSPRRRREIAVIPIGSNIPAVAAREKAIDLVYFGIIRENGRLESFLDVLERLPRGSVRAAILGSVAAGSAAYARAIEARAAAIGATLRLEADAQEVAELLSASKVALLPYDDGISSRRGTALAAMANGALVVTTPPHRAEEAFFSSLCLTGTTTEELTDRVRAALGSYEGYAGMRELARDYAGDHDWLSIAARYRAVLD